MKNLINILSNNSDFFSEKHRIFKGGKPNDALSKALDSKLTDVFPEAKKDLIKTPTKAQLRRQAEAAKRELAAHAKRKRLEGRKRLSNDYKETLKEAESTKLTKKEFQKAHTALVYALRDTGPETNKREDISPKVVRLLSKELQDKVPDYNKYVKAYHILRKYGSAEKVNQRRLIKQVKDKLMPKVSDKLLAYMLKIEMGPVKIEPGPTKVAKKGSSNKKNRANN